jgi:hypothetical protein
MNTDPLKRTLSVTGLLLAGAACGVAATKLLAPQWLLPTAANASLSPATQPISIVPAARPPTPAKTLASKPVAPKTNPFSARERAERQHLAVNQLVILRSELELYKLQHHDKLPEFTRHLWNQLTKATRPDGTIDPVGACGPYLQSVPVNPLNDFSSLGLVRKDPLPGQVMRGEKLGYVLCVTTGRIFATAPDGKTIFDDAAVQDDFPPESAEGKAISLKEQLQTLRADLELYKLQHMDLPPDFVHNPAWEQMTRRTRSTGAFDLRGVGPYLPRRPVNPVNGFYKVETAHTVGPDYHAHGKQIGYVFENSTGRLFGTDEHGKLWKE